MEVLEWSIPGTPDIFDHTHRAKHFDLESYARTVEQVDQVNNVKAKIKICNEGREPWPSGYG